MGEWEQWQPAPVARFEAFSAVVDDDIYRFSGFREQLETTSAAFRYDPETQTATPLHDIPEPVTHVNAVVDGRHIWTAGGFVGKSVCEPCRADPMSCAPADVQAGPTPRPAAR